MSKSAPKLTSSHAANAVNKLRVFISYSHDEVDLARRVVELLKKNGLAPIWDENFSYGHGFHDQIRSFISHAHVFLPIITPESSRRGWVHQEIGYAMGMNIPVLPVCYLKEERTETKDRIAANKPTNRKRKSATQRNADVTDRDTGETTDGPPFGPGQFLQFVQAVELKEPVEEQGKLFIPEVFTGLVSRYDDPAGAFYRCSDLREERAIMMADYASESLFVQHALKLADTGHVRQRGGLSSFHIPTQVISDSIWRDRYKRDPKQKDAEKNDPAAWWSDEFWYEGPTRFHAKMQHRERWVLEKHAKNSGCSLIINPNKYLKTRIFSDDALRVRLLTLIEFLEVMQQSDQEVVVALNPDMEDQYNTTIVGDWFAAESVSMAGPRQTNFTTHAPSIARRIDLFDQELEQLLKTRGWTRESSLAEAITVLEDLAEGRD